MAKKISFRKSPVNHGYVVERKELKKWRGVDKEGNVSEEVFWYRNGYLAELAIKNFEQRAEILPTDIIGGDTELQVD